MKKRYVIIIGGILLLLGIVLYVRNLTIRNDSGINYIEYSYGGGYGTIADTATKTIKISGNGKVVFSNSYNNSVQKFRISQETYNDLCQYIEENSSIFIIKPHENNNVLDAGSADITIRYDDGAEYTVGGYAISNQKFSDMEEHIIDAVGRERFYEYVDSIE